MSIAHVADWTGNSNLGSGSSVTLSAIDSSGANFIAVSVSDGHPNNIANVQDSKSNTYSLAKGPNNNGGDAVSIYYAENPTVGSGHTITVNLTSGGFHVAAAAACYSGMNTSSTLDASAAGTGSSTSLDSGSTATTAQADELCIGAGTLSNGSNSTFSGTNGYTIDSQYGRADLSTIIHVNRKIVSATGAQNSTCDWGGASGNWVEIIATFKGTAATPTITSVQSWHFIDTQTGILVTGSAFGSSQGAGTVKISPTDNVADGGAVSQTVTSWGATSINFTAVLSTLSVNTTLYLFVTENGGTSNANGWPVRFDITGKLAWIKA